MSQLIRAKDKDDTPTGCIAAAVYQHPTRQRDTLDGVTLVLHGVFWAKPSAGLLLPTLPAIDGTVDVYAIRTPEYPGIVYCRPFSSDDDDGGGIHLIAMCEVIPEYLPLSAIEMASLKLFRELVLGDAYAGAVNLQVPILFAIANYYIGNPPDSTLWLAGDFTGTLYRVRAAADLQRKEGVLDIVSLLQEILQFPVEPDIV